MGGQLLRDSGLSWFNPDAWARECRHLTGWDQPRCNAEAWQEGLRRLRRALDGRSSFAFETTLGGHTMTATLLEARYTHDVQVWYVGLASVDLHLARVAARVAAGGHAIPETVIRARCIRSPLNLIRLMPHLARLRVLDNSRPAADDGTVPDPRLVMSMEGGVLRFPGRDDASSLAQTPDWAKPLVMVATGLG